MSHPICVLRAASFLLLFAPLASGQYAPEARSLAEVEEVCDWAAPLLWKPTAAHVPGDARTEAADSASSPLPLIAISPCRIADTRNPAGPYGAPALAAGVPRNFTLTGVCGIAPSAAAASLNVTVTNTQGPGFILIHPQGGSQPNVSTLNYVAGQTIANAAVVPLGAGGGITVVAGVSGTDLILDVNGYYDSNGLITGVTPGTGLSGGGTSGTVSLAIAPGGVTSTELATSAVTSSKIAANAVTAGAIAPGQAVKSVNGVTDAVTITGGGGTSVSTVGSTLTVSTQGFVPSGSFLLGNPNDTTMIGAGYTELGPTNQSYWKATSTAGAPAARYLHTAVWTGTKMIVWGGYSGGFLNTGGLYDPVADSWSTTSTVGAPTARTTHTAVWTGTKMIVWGGQNGTNRFNTGGQYDPIGNSWSPTATAGAPAERMNHTAVWTGSKMIVWGGSAPGAPPPYFDTGGQYDPVANSWSPTNTAGAPAGREGHTAGWSGSKMVVWGGANAAYLNTGGRYDPVGDTWSDTTLGGAPPARTGARAVWTGTRLIVWGGFDAVGQLNTGGQYDPIANTWSATETSGAPTGRAFHTAVWTGSRMIVWGGNDGAYVNTGGQYDPAGNTWSPTATTGAPTIRGNHAAVWTGSRMVVCGGYDGFLPTNTGGQYGLLSLYMKN